VACGLQFIFHIPLGICPVDFNKRFSLAHDKHLLPLVFALNGKADKQATANVITDHTDMHSLVRGQTAFLFDIG